MGYNSRLKQTALFSKQCSQYNKATDIANILLARDYKGFGNQDMNRVIERGCYNYDIKNKTSN